MRNAHLRFDLANLRILHERNRRAVAELEKAVEGVLHAMHPVQRLELHANDLGVELDLRLNVLGANCQMMDSVGQTHGAPPPRDVPRVYLYNNRRLLVSVRETI
jgi:hypothetical protein